MGPFEARLSREIRATRAERERESLVIAGSDGWSQREEGPTVPSYSRTIRTLERSLYVHRKR